VFNTDGKTGKVKYGKDAKRVCAFFPQGCAAAFMRDNSLLLAYGDRAAEWLGIEPLGWAMVISIGFQPTLWFMTATRSKPPDGKEDEAAEVLERVLTRPIPQLANLRVGAKSTSHRSVATGHRSIREEEPERTRDGENGACGGGASADGSEEYGGMRSHKVKRCTKCRKKRWVFVTHFTKDRWGNSYRNWQCSRGHKWREMVVDLRKAGQILAKVYLPAVRKMLNQPSPLMKYLERAA
jgi:hypothetical protein